MKNFFGMGVVALALAAVPTQQASAGSDLRFSIGMNFSWQTDGRQCRGHRGCFGNGQQQYIATFPGFEQHAPPLQPRFPPPPSPAERIPGPAEETTMQWGYPNLNYSYYHPVSYYPAQLPPSYAPANYYPQQYYYPAPASNPNYYPRSGVTFDR